MSKTPLSDEELAHFRELLTEKRREVVENAQRLREAGECRSAESELSSIPTHQADMGTDAHQQEINLELMEQEMGLLREIDDALGRIADKTYGLCEGTGRPIAKERLEAQPWARYSLEYKRQMEG
jgi:DnaK suppressor protein